MCDITPFLKIVKRFLITNTTYIMHIVLIIWKRD